MHFSAALNQENNRWDVRLGGELDFFDAPELKRQLVELIEQNKIDINMECKDLQYLDSTSLGVLVSVLKKVREYEGTISITGLKPFIPKIFTITGLDKIFNIEVDMS